MLPLSYERARPRSGCRTPAHESHSLSRTFIGLAYTQIKLLKI
jgi:hypothetical protein